MAVRFLTSPTVPDGSATGQGVAADQCFGTLAPSDLGLLAANYDPQSILSNTIPGANGTLMVQKLWTPRALTVTYLACCLGSILTTATSGQNKMAIYNSAKSLLGTTADQSTAWASTGMKLCALTAQVSVAAGVFYVGFWVNASTRPGFYNQSSSLGAYINPPSGTEPRWSTGPTGLTTTAPASLGTLTAATIPYWIGVQ